MKISIVTINYNNAEGLEKTILSVERQQYPDIEYIIVDGGSTDDSVTVIKNHNNSVAWWVSEPDKGVYQAMNKGIRKATGDYLLFLNSGDQLFNDSVIGEFVAKGFTEDLVYGDLFLEGQRITSVSPDTITFQHLFGGALPHPSLFFKRPVFDKAGLYNEDFRIISDWLCYSTALVKCDATYKHFNCTVSIFNEDGISSRDTSLSERERVVALKRYFPLFYDDYVSNRALKGILADYNKSKIVRGVMRFQQSKLYSYFRKYV